jgi:hypothetical protein
MAAFEASVVEPGAAIARLAAGPIACHDPAFVLVLMAGEDATVERPPE